jgi:microcystin-dependent protein
VSDAFIGDIKLTAFGFAPKGWALCNGQLLAISQNQALFSLLGAAYGGNGVTTFALPDLRARVPLHAGATAGGNYDIGQQGGEAGHTLTVSEIPVHTHPVRADASPGTVSVPGGALLAGSAQAAYGASADTAMNPLAAGPAGESQPHPNLPPFLVLNFIICLNGIYPPRG